MRSLRSYLPQINGTDKMLIRIKPEKLHKVIVTEHRVIQDPVIRVKHEEPDGMKA